MKQAGAELCQAQSKLKLICFGSFDLVCYLKIWHNKLELSCAKLR